VTPAIGQRFNLEQVPDAIEQLAAGELSGKSVITIER
jgi:hypothetical protein